MPTWNEIKDYARSKYRLAEDDEKFFSLVFEFDDGRTQKIFVRVFEAFSGEWIEFRSIVGPGDKMQHQVALQKNADFACGALALDKDGDYIFVYNAPLATMDVDEFELPLHVVARTADRLEKDYVGNDEW